MLRKLDRATMAYGLEGRVPLLDEDFARAMLDIPVSAHLSTSGGKSILQRWAQESVPGVDFERPKHGFDVPMQEWLTEGLDQEVKSMLCDGISVGLFNTTSARGVADRMRAGVPGAAHTLYAMVFAAIWCQRTCAES